MTTTSGQSPTRLASIDTYRGFVMLLMMAEVLELLRVSKALPTSGFWAFLAYHQTHVDWAGCSLHDLIQPSFSFLVGVALPFSLAKRMARPTAGDALAVPTNAAPTDTAPRDRSRTKPILHAAWRALILILLGIFLRSIGQPQTRFTFEDTLTQIGLGYLPLFLLAMAPRRVWWIALIVILFGYWLAFVMYPLPPADFDYARVGVPSDWQHHATGIAAHWNKNSNLAWAFDTWFMNLFPRAEPFVFHRGGYATLSFIPTLATMILGLIAGDWLRRASGAGYQSQATILTRSVGEERPVTAEQPRLRFGLGSGAITPTDAIRRLLLTGVVLIAAGLALHHAGLGPNVKRIWTPSWTLFSGSWCCLILAGCYGLIDVWRSNKSINGTKPLSEDRSQLGIGHGVASYKDAVASYRRGYAGPPRWTFPLRVIGMNSIAAYMIAHLFEKFLIGTFVTHLGLGTLRYWGEAYEPLVIGVLVLTTYWLILYWMYRKQLFLKI